MAIQLGLSWFVGLGVGAGANVLLRFACDNPDRVAGLVLANGSAEAAGEIGVSGGGQNVTDNKGRKRKKNIITHICTWIGFQKIWQTLLFDLMVRLKLFSDLIYCCYNTPPSATVCVQHRSMYA